MRVDRLSLVNFRRFVEKTVEFRGDFNVLIGENGAGKTAILDALSLLPAAWIRELGRGPAAAIETDDIRLIRQHTKSGVFTEQAPATQVQVEGPDLSMQFGRVLSHLGSTMGPLPEVDAIKEGLAAGTPAPLPLLAMFGTDRLWVAEAPHDDPLEPDSRLAGYDGAMSAASTVDDLIRWMKTQELIALQEGESPLGLEAVRKAVVGCVEDAKDIRYIVREGELVLSFEDGRKLPFRLLSDGVRNMVAMVADLARRAVTLNPWAGDEAPAESPGLVLIDELDLHLHPRWQKRVVDDLRRTFPKVQFVATTHSPFIVQSLRPGELINLDGRPELPGGSVEDIAEEVMGVAQPQRSRHKQEMLEVAREYYRLLDDAKGATAAQMNAVKRKLDVLSERFSDDPATAAMLEAERIAAGLAE